MCGIAGFFALGGSASSAQETDALLRRMGQAIAHRGPDDTGVWIDQDAGLGFVHRRLSIIDLSPAGHQPMHSLGGQYVLVFNGEIYNHGIIRAELEGAVLGQRWRGHSDTETLLAAIEAWGVVAAVERCIGMFAFALWDRASRMLTLGRDRLGEKPLYYGWQGRTLIFGSELKALKAHPAFAAGVNRNAITLLMRHNYIPAPYSIYEGISKLPPGNLLTVRAGQRDAVPIAYWAGLGAVDEAIAHPFRGTPAEAVDALEALLKDAIGQQMVADVPLGAFLSGGVDSSTVVALMQSQSVRPVRTFSIGFDVEGYDEARHAKAVARHLGTDHTEMYVSVQDALDVIPRLSGIYDEPFADSSQIPTIMVSRIARQQVAVSLSGDAGDELFCGYNRYMLGDRLWRRLSRLPRAVRRGVATSLQALSPRMLNALIGPVQWLLPERHRLANWGDKVHKGAGVLASESSAALYRGLVSHWHQPTELVLNAEEPPTLLDHPTALPAVLSDIEQMMVSDMVTYLPDDILCKVDRAAMSVSLETRMPFLDHRVISFAWQLPLDYKLRNGVTKWALREVLYRHVPRALIERPKMGFGVPIDHWLRGPLKDWAADLMDPVRLRQEGFFDAAIVQRYWTEHISGRRNWQYHLWDILMFQAWLRANSGSSIAKTHPVLSGERALA
jgi:asparagine synthase (glutamine-hydrolysing)